jgi:hypothetical protein
VRRELPRGAADRALCKPLKPALRQLGERRRKALSFPLMQFGPLGFVAIQLLRERERDVTSPEALDEDREGVG